MLIDICVATFRRPDLLAILLESLAGQVVAADIEYRIIVIDNDESESARATIESLREKLPCRILYAVEPVRGISYARNRAISLVTGDCLAFLDDDEFVTVGWLQSMVDTLGANDVDMVFGPVDGIIPADAPDWAKVNPIFSVAAGATGTPVEDGASGNVLLRVASLGEPRALFDEAFALTGGEDAEFFCRLRLAGCRQVWCREAKASEHVPPERLTTRWVYRRYYRTGQTQVRIPGVPRGYARLVAVIRGVVQLVAVAARLPLARSSSIPAYVLLRCRMSRVLGRLSVLVGLGLYKEYSDASYRRS